MMKWFKVSVPILWLTAFHGTIVEGESGCLAGNWEHLVDHLGGAFSSSAVEEGGAEEQVAMKQDHSINHGGGQVERVGRSEEVKDLMVDEVVEEMGIMVEEVIEQVGVLLGQVVEKHLSKCHLVMVDTGHHTLGSTPFIRHVSAAGVGLLIVDARQIFSQTRSAKYHLLQGLWGDAVLGCRALILINNRKDLVLRFLEWCELWRRPETVVMLVGRRERVESVLYHPSLRNTLHILYLALQTHQGLRPHTTWRWRSYRREEDDWVWLYGRCLYCNMGRPHLQLLQEVNLTSEIILGHTLFHGQTLEMMGRQLRVGVMHYIPFVDYKRDASPGSTTIKPRDSLDVRLLNTISAHLNFTYVMQESPDHEWGVPGTGGNWTGIVGLLQKQQVDMTIMLLYTVPRAKVIEYSKIYNHDLIVITSMKPEPLPHHRAIIRPFSDLVWQLLLVGLVLWGMFLWLMVKARCWVADERGLSLDSALFFTWAIMLENSPDSLPNNLVARVLIGWWLVVCVVISSAYRSSLVAFLSVEGHSPPINTFQELVSRQGWSWGTSPMMCMGAFREFFTEGGSLLRHVFDQLEVHSPEASLDRVLQGGFSFITLKAMVRSVISRRYTDRHGEHPFYIGTGYKYLSGYSWAFRKGAPFRLRIAAVKQRLLEAGLVEHYLEDVLAKMKVAYREGASDQQQDDGGQVVLGLSHLQGAFSLLGIGCGLSLLILLVETVVYRYTKPRQLIPAASRHVGPTQT